jgi:hypothetical protein
MSGRRTATMAAVAALVVALLAGAGSVVSPDALATLELGHDPAVPYALARPLWTDVAASSPATGPDRATLSIIRREQARGVLRDVLGPRPARLVRLGTLQDHGRTVGATALLALPVARDNVRATVPNGGRPVRFTVPILRDVLVDVNLRRGAVVTVEPGPASRTTTWAAGASPASPVATVAAAAPGGPSLVQLSAAGPSFAPYDGTPTLGRTGRDWPVSLIFAGHATVAKVKHALRTVGFTHQGERRWLAYRTSGGALRFDSDQGLKTAQDANGTDVHLRLYAPPGTDHFTDPRLGDVVAATVHLDRGESPATGPRLFGFSEEAERRVADTLAHRRGWHAQHDRVALGNAEPYRRDLAAPDHVWWSNGRATLISVP